MSERPPHTEHMIDAYLDGGLQGPERAEFEKRLERDADLRTEVERQIEIDGAIKRLVRPPSQKRLDAIAETAARCVAQDKARPGGTWRIMARRLAVAAAVAGGIVGVWQIWHVVGRPTTAPYERRPWQSLETAYRVSIDEGFRPEWVCKDDREFAETFRTAYGQPLLLSELPPDTAALGLSYCNSITPRTTYLLARAGGEPVVVFIDRLEHDGEQRVSGGLSLFRRQIGRLVLYELSSLEQPALLPRFFSPGARAEGAGGRSERDEP